MPPLAGIPISSELLHKKNRGPRPGFSFAPPAVFPCHSEVSEHTGEKSFRGCFPKGRAFFRVGSDALIAPRRSLREAPLQPFLSDKISEREKNMLLEITDDFDLDKIARSGQCFRWEKTPDGAWRILSGGECLYIRDLGNGQFEADCGEAGFADLWRPYFDLDTDYAAVRARIDPERDPFLFRAARAERGIRILRQDPWETLVSFIISQNRNIPAICRSVALLCERCGEPRTDRRGREYFAFPAPEAVAALEAEDLRRCALGYRCGYVHAAAEAVLSGVLDFSRLAEAEDAEVMAALTAVRGVGVKVASCAALFGLHRLNAFPRDVWINRALEQEYPNGYPMEEYAPYNGIYQQYMFAYYRNK